MSSLWAMLRKKDAISYDKELFTKESVVSLMKALWVPSRLPILVNATTLVGDLKAERCGLGNSYDLTPGFPLIWIEYMNNYSDGSQAREATAIFRHVPSKSSDMPIPETAAHYLILALWRELDGGPALAGGAKIMIDSLGNPVPGAAAFVWEGDSLNRQFAIALETLTTMNTRGTRIEPPLNGKPVQVVKPNRAPCSIWRTIHLPKMALPPLEGAETSDTILERREHWVRAHRKDYRQGAGLFGRVKALVWVPEFQRGNPELGTVKQTYNVHQPRLMA